MVHCVCVVTGGLDLTPLITRRFGLERWAGAVLTASTRGRLERSGTARAGGRH
jgi:hypothetical protein